MVEQEDGRFSVAPSGPTTHAREDFLDTLKNVFSANQVERILEIDLEKGQVGLLTTSLLETMTREWATTSTPPGHPTP